MGRGRLPFLVSTSFRFLGRCKRRRWFSRESEICRTRMRFPPIARGAGPPFGLCETCADGGSSPSLGLRNPDGAAFFRRHTCSALDSAERREAAVEGNANRRDPLCVCKDIFVVCPWMGEMRIFAREKKMAPSDHVRLGRRDGARQRSAFGRNVVVTDVGPHVWLRVPRGASGHGIRGSPPSQSGGGVQSMGYFRRVLEFFPCLGYFRRVAKGTGSAPVRGVSQVREFTWEA